MEIVNGTVIGEVTTERPYAFFDLDGKQITPGKWFDNDENAINWFKVGWPEKFKAGVEMRCYLI